MRLTDRRLRNQREPAHEDMRRRLYQASAALRHAYQQDEAGKARILESVLARHAGHPDDHPLILLSKGANPADPPRWGSRRAHARRAATVLAYSVSLAGLLGLARLTSFSLLTLAAVLLGATAGVTAWCLCTADRNASTTRLVGIVAGSVVTLLAVSATTNLHRPTSAASHRYATASEAFTNGRPDVHPRVRVPGLRTMPPDPTVETESGTQPDGAPAPSAQTPASADTHRVYTVYFAPDSSVPDIWSRMTVTRASSDLLSNRPLHLQVMVVGHALLAGGPPQGALELSRRRADAVRVLLEQKVPPPVSFTAIGTGASFPSSRSVDIVIITFY